MFAKSFKALLALVLIVTCSGLSFAKGKAYVETTVASVDVHGNVNLAIKGGVFLAKGFSASDIVNISVDKYKFSAPIVKNYSDVNNGDFLIRMNGDEISLAINMGNFSEVSGAKIGSKVTISLKEHYGYLTSYQVRVLKKSNDREKFDSDEIFANFRNVTGGSISAEKLYRSYNPIESDERAPFAAKLMEDNGITLVVNLADTNEIASQREESSAYYKKLDSEGKVVCVNMGSAFSGDEFHSKLKSALVFIANHPGEKILIHGKEGKNRTGFVVAMLLALNGASYSDIENDFMKSFENFYGVKKNRQKQQYELLSEAVPFMFVTMNNGKKFKEDNIQSIAQNYLINTVGVPKPQVDALSKIFK